MYFACQTRNQSFLFLGKHPAISCCLLAVATKRLPVNSRMSGTQATHRPSSNKNSSPSFSFTHSCFLPVRRPLLCAVFPLLSSQTSQSNDRPNDYFSAIFGLNTYTLRAYGVHITTPPPSRPKVFTSTFESVGIFFNYHSSYLSGSHAYSFLYFNTKTEIPRSSSRWLSTRITFPRFFRAVNPPPVLPFLLKKKTGSGLDALYSSRQPFNRSRQYPSKLRPWA